MTENQHAPCPFCGGTDLMEINSPRFGDVGAWIICCERECYAHGPQCAAETVQEAIAAAWEAWDAAGRQSGERVFSHYDP